jgi:hypothetical protein
VAHRPHDFGASRFVCDRLANRLRARDNPAFKDRARKFEIVSLFLEGSFRRRLGSWLALAHDSSRRREALDESVITMFEKVRLHGRVERSLRYTIIALVIFVASFAFTSFF